MSPVEPPLVMHPSPIYTATVAMAAQGMLHQQASARAVSDDGALALVLRPPAALGGRGAGTNAEQLLAAGIAAGFHGALMLVALSKGMQLAGTVSIVASVQLERDPFEDGFSLALELEVALPAMATSDAQSLMLAAERQCAYAKMARSGIRSSFILR